MISIDECLNKITPSTSQNGLCKEEGKKGDEARQPRFVEGKSRNESKQIDIDNDQKNRATLSQDKMYVAAGMGFECGWSHCHTRSCHIRT